MQYIPIPFIITPHVSVNQYCFGDARNVVIKKDGHARKIIENHNSKIITEERMGCDLEYENNKLYSILIYANFAPLIDGFNLYEEEGIERIKSIYPNFIEGKRYICFKELGICVGGFSRIKLSAPIWRKRCVIAFASTHMSLLDSYAKM
jgi:hypothetical protein